MTSERRGACDPTLLFLLLIAEELRHLCCHPPNSSLARPSVHAARPSRNAAMTRALTKCTYLPPHPSKHPLTTRTAGAPELAERHSPGPRECPGGPASASSPLPTSPAPGGARAPRTHKLKVVHARHIDGSTRGCSARPCSLAKGWAVGCPNHQQDRNQEIRTQREASRPLSRR